MFREAKSGLQIINFFFPKTSVALIKGGVIWSRSSK